MVEIFEYMSKKNIHLEDIAKDILNGLSHKEIARKYKSSSAI